MGLGWCSGGMAAKTRITEGRGLHSSTRQMLIERAVPVGGHLIWHGPGFILTLL